MKRPTNAHGGSNKYLLPGYSVNADALRSVSCFDGAASAPKQPIQFCVYSIVTCSQYGPESCRSLPARSLPTPHIYILRVRGAACPNCYGTSFVNIPPRRASIKAASHPTGNQSWSILQNRIGSDGLELSSRFARGRSTSCFRSKGVCG